MKVRAGVPCAGEVFKQCFALRSSLMTLQLSIIAGSLCPSVGRILDMDGTVLSSLTHGLSSISLCFDQLMVDELTG